jgi:hypothetical protein
VLRSGLGRDFCIVFLVRESLFALRVRDLRPLLFRKRSGVVLLVRKARCTFRVREKFVVAFRVRERLVCSPG